MSDQKPIDFPETMDALIDRRSAEIMDEARASIKAAQLFINRSTGQALRFIRERLQNRGTINRRKKVATTKIPQSQALAIPLTPCTSRQVASFGYDADTSTLAMQFHQGQGLSAVYQYPNVPKETYDGLCAHESKGKYFAKHIRDLNCVKVVPD